MKKTWLIISIGIVGLLVFFLCFYYAEHNSGVIQIPVFKMLGEIVKVGWEWTFGFV